VHRQRLCLNLELFGQFLVELYRKWELSKRLLPKKHTKTQTQVHIRLVLV
jgi:hypothetical protein